MVFQAMLRYQENLVSGLQSGARLDNPCFNSGYSESITVDGNEFLLNGTGNATACLALARDLLHLDCTCHAHPPSTLKA